LLQNDQLTGIQDSLINASPLADEVLLATLATPTPLSAGIIQNVFTHQPGLSDTVLIALMQRSPAVQFNKVKNILLALDHDMTEQVLIEAMDLVADNTSPKVMRDLLLQQSYVSEGTLLAYLGHTYDFQEVHLEKVLIQRNNVTDTVFQALVNRSPLVADETLTNVWVAASPFPGDPAILSAIHRSVSPVADSTIEHLLIASPYRISPALDSAFAQRSPAPSTATMDAIRAAQTGKPTLLQYQAGLVTDPDLLPGYANAVTHANLNDLLNALAGTETSLIRSTLLTASPLADTVLLEMIRRTPLLPNDVLQDVLNEQPGLSEAVLQELFARSGLANSVIETVLDDLEHPFTEAVLLDLIQRDPAFSDAFVYAQLQRQVLLPESVALALANQSAGVPNAVSEPVLLKQPLVSDNVLNAALNRTSSPLANSTMGTLLLKQPVYPSDNVLVTMLQAANPIGDPWLMKVLSASPVELSTTVITALDAKSPAMNAGLRSALDYALSRKDGAADTSLTRYCARPEAQATLEISTITDYDYYDATANGSSISKGYQQLLGQPEFLPYTSLPNPVDLKWEPSWQLFSQTTYSPQQPGAVHEQEYFYYYDLKNRYDRFGQYYDAPFGFSLENDTVLRIDSVYYDSTNQVYVQVPDTVIYPNFYER
ncbi:MAG: hypothetical protein AAGB22_07935, partial [Bacteroidota bacterium]